jgi:hypothetical protein
VLQFRVRRFFNVFGGLQFFETTPRENRRAQRAGVLGQIAGRDIRIRF